MSTWDANTAIDSERCEEWMDDLSRMIEYFQGSVIFGVMTPDGFIVESCASDHPVQKAKHALESLQETHLFCLDKQFPV